MILGGYRLEQQLSAGSAGAVYRAVGGLSQSQMEVRVLSGVGRDSPAWHTICRRLHLVSMLEAPVVQRVSSMSLDSDPAYVVMDWVGDRTLVDALEAGPYVSDAILKLGLSLADGLKEAHRLGLVHGALAPSVVSVDINGQATTDFTGIPVWPPGRHLRTKMDRSCRAPELDAHDTHPSADVFALGALLYVARGGAPGGLEQIAADPQLGPDWTALLNEMLDLRPEFRPTAAEVFARLHPMASERELTIPNLASAAPSSAPLEPSWSPLGDTVAQPSRWPSEDLEAVAQAGLPSPASVQELGQLGRFKLLECIGRGGMGEVYRARDLADGRDVAIKVLLGEWGRDPDALKRFRKEARLLSEVRNPYVANLIEVNEDRGVHYIAVEFVDGESLQDRLDAIQKLPASDALTILADVSRALLDAHRRGIVHRDIKPANILIAKPNADTGSDPTRPFKGRVKLVDFGIARQVEQSESMALTQDGAALGTPLYMAPEQCTAASPVGPCSDVYAMGATLFHMVAGKPPFSAPDALTIMLKHVREQPPRLVEVAEGAPNEVSQLADRALAKEPTQRFADATELLEAIEALLVQAGERSESRNFDAHPRLPEHKSGSLRVYSFEWELQSRPDQLWPFVANTDRLNRAVGLKAVEFEVEKQPGRAASFLVETRLTGLAVKWREHPFEWIEGRRFAVLREFPKGPLRWYVSETELQPLPEGGSRLIHTVRVCPRNIIGRLVAAIQVGRGLKKQLNKLYPRIDAMIQGTQRGPDPFEPNFELSDAARQRLDRLIERVVSLGVDPDVAMALGRHLAAAPPQEAARIRPLALARRLGVDPSKLIDACLVAAHEGLLIMMWDILCPSCQIPSEVKDSLRRLDEHARCEACDIDFEIDFANAIEMIFRVHPSIRESEVRTYCLGGPSHSPHVAAQVRLEPGERVVLNLKLDDGAYRLRSPQLADVYDFRVETPAQASRVDLDLTNGPVPGDLPETLTAGFQVLALVNRHASPVMLRVEHRAPRDDALTAARACTIALFRRLFPNEVLSDGQTVQASSVTLLVSEIADVEALFGRLGDAAAYTLAQTQLSLIGQAVEGHGGALLRSVGTGVVAVFGQAAAAVRAAIDLQRALRNDPATSQLRLRVALHRGPVMVSTVDGRLDYFGLSVDQALRLPRAAGRGRVLISRTTAEDPDVLQAYQQSDWQAEVVGVDGLAGGREWGIVLSPPPATPR